MNGLECTGQSKTKTLDTSLIDSMINDIEKSKVKDSILIIKDSLLFERSKRLSLSDTIISYQGKQITLLTDRLEVRTSEVNMLYIDIAKVNDKVRKRNTAIIILSSIVAVLTTILVLK